MINTAKSPLLLKVAALAAAFSLQGAALAATVNAPSPLLVAAAEQGATAQPSDQVKAPRADKSVRGHRHQHQKAVMMVPGYGGLSEAAVKTLSLNEAQSKLLADAQAAQKEARKSRFESMKTERQARSEQLKAGKIDPHAAVKQADEARNKALEARNQISAKWFAVWDSLDATQHQKVATLLSERVAQRGERMKDMKHKGSHHSGQTQSDSKAATS